MLTLVGSFREFVEREVANFARRNPGVVIYVNARPCNVPRVVAEYREEGRARGWRAAAGLARPTSPRLTPDRPSSSYSPRPAASERGCA